MASNLVSIQRRGFGQTMRRDGWWIAPLLTFLGLGAFIVYSTWAAFQGEHYFVQGTGYLSPMYSPVLFDSWKIAPAVSGHSWFGPWPAWLPQSMILPLTPAFLILWAPGGFRFTCYYYRGAYYKSFWADPPACAVGEPRHDYRGEKKLPLILQNIHRYFLYLALVFICILAYDAWSAMWFTDARSGTRFGIGVGTLVLSMNVVLLGSYTFGCHSLRHLVGGRCDTISTRPVQHKLWKWVSKLNKRHMLFAWLSLFWVGFSDFYVRMVSMGIWADYRFF